MSTDKKGIQKWSEINKITLSKYERSATVTKEE